MYNVHLKLNNSAIITTFMGTIHMFFTFTKLLIIHFVPLYFLTNVSVSAVSVVTNITWMSPGPGVWPLNTTTRGPGPANLKCVLLYYQVEFDSSNVSSTHLVSLFSLTMTTEHWGKLRLQHDQELKENIWITQVCSSCNIFWKSLNLLILRKRMVVHREE